MRRQPPPPGPLPALRGRSAGEGEKATATATTKVATRGEFARSTSPGRGGRPQAAGEGAARRNASDSIAPNGYPRRRPRRAGAGAGGSGGFGAGTRMRGGGGRRTSAAGNGTQRDRKMAVSSRQWLGIPGIAGSS